MSIRTKRFLGSLLPILLLFTLLTREVQVIDIMARTAEFTAAKPEFVFDDRGAEVTLVIVDGNAGHAQKRMAGVTKSFEQHNVLYVNPGVEGELYDFESLAMQIQWHLIEKRLRRVILAGISLGYAVQYRVLMHLESYNHNVLPSGKFTVEGVVAIDPLRDRSQIKAQLLAKAISRIKAGPIQNRLFGRLPKLVLSGGKTTDEFHAAHRKWGQSMLFSRWAGEIAASITLEEPMWLPKGKYPLVILLSEKDAVLHRAHEQIKRDFGATSADSRVEIVLGAEHASIDKHSARWLPHLTDAFNLSKR